MTTFSNMNVCDKPLTVSSLYESRYLESCYFIMGKPAGQLNGKDSATPYAQKLYLLSTNPLPTVNDVYGPPRQRFSQ